MIDEIMADPSPVVGLPSLEWVELRNSSSTPINLKDWRLSDTNSQSGPFPFFMIQPDSLVIICSNSSSSQMQSFGRVLIVSNFPALDNNGELLSLRSNTGLTIHAVQYTSAWHSNELKKEGGWSLEMIDPHCPCVGNENWTSSSSPFGGTPGEINSVDGNHNDNIDPQLTNAYTTDSLTITLLFSEPLDSFGAAIVSNYAIDQGLAILSADPVSPLFDQVELKLNVPLQPGSIYKLSVNNLTDCSNNYININRNTTRIGIPSSIPVDVAINEILFNPRSGGSDYVEFFNRGDKVIDASKLKIANRNTSGLISSIQTISSLPFYLYPGDYIVVTTDPVSLALDYLVKDPRVVIHIPSMPSFPDDEGTILLLDFQGRIIDELKYSDDWHFVLIHDKEGIALERIDPFSTTQKRENWHSAASTSGYGTPGYENSQLLRLIPSSSEINITPKIFSPDNDGNDDVLIIRYKFLEPGFAVNSYVFDVQGRVICHLVKNDLAGTEGFWKWDGLDENKQVLPSGIYVIYMEIFNLKGQIEKFRKAVVLAHGF